jgi:hypothetical protein
VRTPALASAVAALAALGATAAVTAPAGAASVVPPCQTRQLVATIGSPDGAAGSVYYKLTLANLGSACSLTGFPGVSAVSVTGRQLGAPATRSGRAGKTIVLKGATADTFATASATLRITEAGNFPSARCGQTLAAGLRVYPPDQRTALAVPLPFQACSKSAAKALSIQTIR